MASWHLLPPSNCHDMKTLGGQEDAQSTTNATASTCYHLAGSKFWRFGNLKKRCLKGVGMRMMIMVMMMVMVMMMMMMMLKWLDNNVHDWCLTMFDAGCKMHNDDHHHHHHHHHHHPVATILYHTSLQPWHRPWRSTHCNSPALEALDVKDTLDRHSGWRQRWKEKGHAFSGRWNRVSWIDFPIFSLQSSFYKANISLMWLFTYMTYMICFIDFFVMIRNVYDFLVQLFSTRFFNVTGDSIAVTFSGLKTWPPLGDHMVTLKELTYLSATWDEIISHFLKTMLELYRVNQWCCVK